MSDFDYNKNETITNLKGTIETSKKWNIGCIVGSSGSGKSTIARTKFSKYYINGFDYDSNSVPDNMDEQCTVEEITKMFYRVGFGSVPEWFKPYSCLSTGERMRVDVARALLQSAKNMIGALYKSDKWFCTGYNKSNSNKGSIQDNKTCRTDCLCGRFMYKTNRYI